jgi:hypothetical protein
MFADELENDHGKTCGRTAHLQRRPCEESDYEAADNARNNAHLWRHARCDGYAHTERHGHQENDDRGGEIAAKTSEKAATLSC